MTLWIRLLGFWRVRWFSAVCLWFSPLLVALSGPTEAKTLDFESVVRQAEEHSLILKIADSDVVLRRIDEKEALSLYLPTVSLRCDIGYAWALDGDQEAVTIGDTVSTTDLSTWRDSISATTSLLLYDGGARQQKLRQARHGIRAAEFARADRLQQVRMEVLDAYLAGLQSQSRIKALSGIVDHCKQLFRVLEELQRAGTVGQIRLQDVALKLATNLSHFEDERLAWQKVLATLTELTGESYQAESTSLSELQPVVHTPNYTLDVERLPRIKALDEELARLSAERSVAWRRLFPSVEFSGSYRMYGSDSDSLAQSWEDLSGRDATAALVMRWEFSGFRDRMHVERLDERLRQLVWQRQQQAVDLKREIGGLRQAVDSLPVLAKQEQDVRQSLMDAMMSANRLRAQQLINELEFLERLIDSLERSLEADLMQHRRQAEAVRLQIWREGQES